jgi:hypothetical protein
VLHRLLLLPLLSPLLAVLLVAAINPSPSVNVRLLTWASPGWPLGAWMASAAGLGAAMSAAGTALALQGGGTEQAARRQVRRRAEPESQDGDGVGRAAEAEAWIPQTPPGWAGPSRNVTDPAPTVSVPFRVIRKGSRATEAVATGVATAAAAQSQGTNTQAAAEGDDWGSTVSDAW